MRKVIFIVNSIQQQRCIKRVNDFIDHGYEVEVYGFSRSKEIPTPPKQFQIIVLGHIDNGTGYAARMKMMYNALQPVFRKHQNEDVLYYYFLLDVAMICCSLSKQPYIYEESDLMQTYLKKPLRWFFDRIDRHIIRHSRLTVMTSEGFLKYHFGGQQPENVVLVPNRLNKTVTQLQYEKQPFDLSRLRVAFVGNARHQSTLRFAEYFLKHFPQHEFHFYGQTLSQKEEYEQLKQQYNNVFFHGKFANPDGLPQIYANSDLVLATYDNQYENVRLAEPNKLYEAIYFRTPIIVSENTFIAEKVNRMGVGFALNPLDENAVTEFFNGLTAEMLHRCINRCEAIPTAELIDNNPLLYEKLRAFLKITLC